METDYFYGKQALQFSFIKLPKILFQDSDYEGLSLQAKVIYGFFLERVDMSIKNDWFDEDNRAFIIYPISDLQEDLGFSRSKTMEWLSELEEVGLIERKRRGFGLPNIIYVKNFIYGTARSSEFEPQKSRFQTSEVQNLNPSSPEFKPLKNKTKKNKTNINNNIYTPLTPLGENTKHNFDKHTNVENINHVLKNGLSDKADVVLGDELLKNLIVEWMEYKDERKPKSSNHYTEKGMCKLLTMIVKNYNEYGYDELKRVVDGAISSNYSGIVWDWLGKNKKASANSYTQAIKNRVDVVESWV